MQHGTAQNQRLSPALQAGYVLPDEFSLAERLRLSLAQSAGLRFVGGNGEGWDAVLRNDETMLMAEVATLPLASMRRRFFAALEWDAVPHLWRKLRDFAQRYDDWCLRLEASETGAGRELAGLLLEQGRQGLAAQWAAGARLFDDSVPGLHPVWRETGPAGEPPGDEDDVRLLLRRCWLALERAVTRVQRRAAQLVEISLSSGRHDPALGLLLAAVQLSHHSRTRLNDFPQRLIDFYYLDMLRLTPRAAEPERVHLLLERESRHGSMVEVAAGACFVGGKDADGQPLPFEAESALAFGDCRVAALCSLSVERDAEISPEREFDFVCRIKVERLPLLPVEKAYETDPPWWPLQGGYVKGSASCVTDAELGLAISSPLLSLKEGRREIRLRMQLAHPADEDVALQQALRTPEEARGAAWLAAVFQRYADWEGQHFPLRVRPGPTPPQLEPAVLARDAWSRAARFDSDVHLAFLLSACLACDDAEWFAERLGRLFAAWLAAAQEELRPEDLAALRGHYAKLRPDIAAREVEIDDPLILIHRSRGGKRDDIPERALLFGRVFAGAWGGRLSTADGWLKLDQVFMRRVEQAGDRPRWGGVIELALRLGEEAPPIVACSAAVHGDGWAGQAALQLSLQTQGRMYTYSLLRQYRFPELNLTVEAHGLRDVVLYNQLGRLDPSKPFHPFGPLPAPRSYLIMGARELACKPLQALRFNLAWSGLPAAAGGMALHYAGYPGDWRNQMFRLRGQVLANGQWAGEAELPLFLAEHGEERLRERYALDFPSAELRRLYKASAPLAAGLPFQYELGSRNGFFRLELAGPVQAFGHAQYPALLGAVLARNARLKGKLQHPLPQEPYTPTLESLTVSYRASQDLPLLPEGGHSGSGAQTSRAYHIHPYGQTDINLFRLGRYPAMLPSNPNAGGLFIGLAGHDPQGALSLFFHLRKAVARERWLEAAPALRWFVWQSAGWLELRPEQVVEDGTRGMLRSGIVRLNLPAGMSTDCAALPGKLYWLKLRADWGHSQLAGLYGVHVHAIRAVCRGVPDKDKPALPPGSVDAPARSLPGLRGVLQVGASFGRRDADPPDVVRMRAAERLRHRRRAHTVWDYERLALDAFPMVFKVKCFAHHRGTMGDGDGLGHDDLAASPGSVLVAVLPFPGQGQLFSSTDAPKLDAAALDEMQAYLQARAPAGAQVRVRNATYERVQARCTLRLSPGSHPGEALRRLNQQLVEYLSPWHETGLAADFDWSLRAEDLEAFLRAQPGVEEVGRLSLLHVVRNDKQFNVLSDTAANAGVRLLRPAQPWSLLLPLGQHLLELSEQARPAPPTGVDKLEVGSTFIIGGADAAAVEAS
ncbi:baseplate J/gp47 family protein [Chromobacterium subtsugae]|uniref:baseplate J/gp47 family protein n=1 Tax=Chromobacterium subtsugae TaxID=251747 RepID=UPI000640CF27|nr:baseplate J/gp47 family protein [Chromobacterium subtsugae]